MPDRDSSAAGSWIGRVYRRFLGLLGISPARSTVDLAFSSRVRADEDRKDREDAARSQREWKQSLDDSRETRAAAGDSHALLALAIQDENLGNFERAIARYRQAAAAGRVGAMFRLGQMHAEGRGVPRDPTEAARWWRMAAELGHDVAAQCLAQLLSGRSDP